MQELLGDNSSLLRPANFLPALVVGLGADIIDVAEFERLDFEQFGAFYRRCFSAAEIEYCRGQAIPAQHFAGRFAAKEAAIKAFSSWRQLAPWQIEVMRHANGAPYLQFWDFEGRNLLDAIAGYSALVSLSHSYIHALAVVIIQNQTGVSNDTN